MRSDKDVLKDGDKILFHISGKKLFSGTVKKDCIFTTDNACVPVKWITSFEVINK